MLLVSLRRACKSTLHLTRIKTQQIYITNQFKIININIIKAILKLRLELILKLKLELIY